MKVKLPTDQTPTNEEVVKGPGEDGEEDVLPPVEDDQIPASDEENLEEPLESAPKDDLRLEVENLKGQVEVLKSIKSPASPILDTQEDRDRQIKIKCQADMNSMDDMTFEQTYRMSKSQANTAIVTYDLEKQRSSNAIKIAELEAKSDLIQKYPSFSKNFEKIKSNVLSDLSPEARQDPTRLKRAMEREFLLMEKENPQPKKKPIQGDAMRRRIVGDFEKPNMDDRARAPQDKDELAPELRQVGARFGITKESQRKKFSSPFIPMDLGGGWKFEDPKRGFERAPKA